MAFFQNRAVNLLNLHYAVHAVAMAGGGAFYLVYLVKAGVAPPKALASIALVLIGRFLVRPLLVPLAVHFGLRALLATGTLLAALQYPLLAEVEGVGRILFALIVLSAITDIIYWTCYHAAFAALGDDGARGRHIGTREAIVALISIFSPLLTGWLLAVYGPRTEFGIAATVQALSAWPLFFLPDVTVAPKADGVVRAAKDSMLLFAADAWMAAGYVLVWQIALFVTLGESFTAYGGALAIAALAAALAGPMLGRSIDGGEGRMALRLTAFVLVGVILARAFATGNATLAVIANAAGALVTAIYMPTVMTAVYTEAKRSACPLRFHIAAEGAWDAGGAAGLLFAAGLLWLGYGYGVCMAFALFGVVLNFVVLRRYYERRAVPQA